MCYRTLSRLAALAWLLVGCSPSPTATTPGADAPPAASPKIAWTLRMNEPRVVVNSAGRVVVGLGGRGQELSYHLAPDRLRALEGEMQGVKDWSATGGSDDGLVRETPEGNTQTALAAHPELRKSLLSFMPRPFAVDEDKRWMGGRLAKGVEAGTLDLLVEEGESVPAESRWTLLPRPEMFRAGDVVVVVGEPTQGEAGIAMGGPAFQVNGICRWPGATPDHSPAP